MIEVAGIQVPRTGMIEVAHRLVLAGEIETASNVLRGFVEGGPIRLTVPDREAVLATLEDPPTGLGQLRTVLREQHLWLAQGNRDTA